MTAERCRLTGWGRAPGSVAEVHRVRSTEVAATLAEIVDSSITRRGVIARGLGRAYGDAALNAGGAVIEIAPEEFDLDVARGRLRVGAGVSLDTILRRAVPQGWFIPVSPGTRFVTVGGAIAAHVHGKNHHRDGSFGAHVRSMTMLMADGSVRVVDQISEPDIWWATLGGMGLTGVILDATIDLLAIETSYCVVDTVRADDLDSLMSTMDSGDDEYRYSVAWIDLVARGRQLGRGVLTRGDHARRSDLPTGSRAARAPLDYDPRPLAAVPPGVPNVLNRHSVRVFNEIMFRRAPRHRTAELQTIPRYFHPLDAVGHWNRLYGRRGFVQYQFVVPFEAAETVRLVIERVARSGSASFLAVLKRFGPGDSAFLGFPMPGWTLTLDVPTDAPDLGILFGDLDLLVRAAAGRLYLAKDAVSTPEMIAAGYPELERWRTVRRRLDPDGIWVSDLGRRLALV